MIFFYKSQKNDSFFSLRLRKQLDKYNKQSKEKKKYIFLQNVLLQQGRNHDAQDDLDGRRDSSKIQSGC